VTWRRAFKKLDRQMARPTRARVEEKEVYAR
jgi:hypothetical protein